MVLKYKEVQDKVMTSVTQKRRVSRSIRPFLTIFASFERKQKGLSFDAKIVKNGAVDRQKRLC